MKASVKMAAIVLMLGVIAWAAFESFYPDRYQTPERIAWKDQAILELSRISPTEKAPLFLVEHDGWFSTEGLVMRDGSWIAFRQNCHKELPEVYDIFIGRGSDGKWYYSTYHFCINAMTIMDDQPESLKAFIDACALVEFDGQPDDCLRPTWPSEEVL